MTALKYNNYRIEGLPEIVWGPRVSSGDLKCPGCGSRNVYYSGTPSDPEEIFCEAVRCGDCGWLTDYYEMYKRGLKEGRVGEKDRLTEEVRGANK